MTRNRIEDQIQRLSCRRLAGYTAILSVIIVIGGVVLGLVAKHVHSKPIITSVAFTVSGFLLGFLTAILTRWSRKILLVIFTVIPLGFSLGMFIFRTILGYSHTIPLLMVVSPLLFPISYLAGQTIWKK